MNERRKHRAFAHPVGRPDGPTTAYLFVAAVGFIAALVLACVG